MTASAEPQAPGNVEHIFSAADSAPVSDELQKLTGVLKSLCPRESNIRFDFDGQLRVRIDVRRFEEMTAVEALLPTICGGIFREVQRGLADKHSFFHRLSAVVGR